MGRAVTCVCSGGGWHRAAHRLGPIAYVRRHVRSWSPSIRHGDLFRRHFPFLVESRFSNLASSSSRSIDVVLRIIAAHHRVAAPVTTRMKSSLATEIVAPVGSADRLTLQ